MSIMKHENLKKKIDIFIEGLSDLSENLEDVGIHMDKGNQDWGEQLANDLLEYAIYLACADGYITQDKCDCIEYYLGYTLSKDQIVSRAYQYKLNTKEFEDTLPHIFVRLVGIGNAMEGAKSFAWEALKVYHLFGRLMAQCDECEGQVTEIRAAAYVGYIWQVISPELDYRLEELAEIEYTGHRRRAPKWELK